MKHEVMVDKTRCTANFWSEIIKVSEHMRGEHFIARVYFDNKLVRESQEIFDQDEATALGERLRAEVNEENFKRRK